MFGNWDREIFKAKFIFKRFDSSLTTKLCPFWLGLEQPLTDTILLSLWLLSSAFMALLSSSSSSTSLSSSSASVFYQLIFASYLSIVTDWTSKIEVHVPPPPSTERCDFKAISLWLVLYIKKTWLLSKWTFLQIQNIYRTPGHLVFIWMLIAGEWIKESLRWPEKSS